MMHFWGVWVKQGVQGTTRGCCNASGSVLICSWALVHGSEWGGAGTLAIIIVNDVVDPVDAWGAMAGSWRTTGVQETSKGGLGDAVGCRVGGWRW
jgi:hypothetical protein